MRKTILFLFLIVIFFLACYKYFISFYLQQEIDYFIKNQQKHGILITADDPIFMNSLFTIRQCYKNIHIKRSNLLYQTPEITFSISLFHPLTLHIETSSQHILNELKITSSPLKISVNLKERTLHASCSNIQISHYLISSINSNLSFRSREIIINNLWVQIGESFLFFEGILSEKQVSLTGSFIRWQSILKDIKETGLLTKNTYKKLYWTLNLLDKGNKVTLPITIKEGNLTIAGVPVCLK